VIGGSALSGIQRIHAGCWVDWDRKGVWRHHMFHPMPYRTWRILRYLLEHANQVIPQAELFAAGWGEPRSRWDLQDHIHRIRMVIEPHPHHPRWLVNRRNSGYELRVEISKHA
jgi:DNA-binding response OmpR family regulator